MQSFFSLRKEGEEVGEQRVLISDVRGWYIFLIMSNVWFLFFFSLHDGAPLSSQLFLSQT